MFFDTSNISRKQSVILLILAAILWSLGGLFIKKIEWTPAAIAGGRSVIAALLLLPLRGKSPIVFSRTLIFGGISYAGVVLLFVISTKLTTAANAIILQYTAPVYVALLSAWFLNEKIRRADWITIIIVLCGLVLFFFDKVDLNGVKGNILALISGVSFAWLVLLMRRHRDQNPLDIIILGNIITAIVTLPFMFDGLPNRDSIYILIALGVVQLALPYVLYSIAIKKVKAVEAITIPMIEPILNPLWVFIFIGEQPGMWSLFGGIVVFIAVSYRGVVTATQRS